MQKYKRRLNEQEVAIAKVLLAGNPVTGQKPLSFAQVAKIFKTNKPSIKKSVGVYNNA